MLALFCAKFACNLAIRYPVFRWELCKSSVWESVKKAQEMCTQEEPHDWLATSELPKVAHVWSMQGSWRVTPAVALQDKTSSLARQLARDSFQSRSRVARMPCLNENWLFTFLTYTTINTLILTKCKEFLEKILREKP